MQHGGRWTALASPYKLILLRDYSRYADVARDLIRTFPDCRELAFKFFWVGMLSDQIARVTIHVESNKRSLWVDVDDEDDGLVASVVVDRLK